jgi:hypothetical protein
MSFRPPSQQLTVGYRVLPVRRNVWRLELFALKDERVLETREVVGSKVKAMSFANSAARVLEVKKSYVS